MQWADLVEVALIHGLCDVADLAALVSFPLLFVELLCQRLQFSQGHLQGQTVRMTDWCVLQHVLMESHTSHSHPLIHHKELTPWNSFISGMKPLTPHSLYLISTLHSIHYIPYTILSFVFTSEAHTLMIDEDSYE